MTRSSCFLFPPGFTIASTSGGLPLQVIAWHAFLLISLCGIICGIDSCAVSYAVSFLHSNFYICWLAIGWSAAAWFAPPPASAGASAVAPFHVLSKPVGGTQDSWFRSNSRGVVVEAQEVEGDGWRECTRSRGCSRSTRVVYWVQCCVLRIKHFVVTFLVRDYNFWCVIILVRTLFYHVVCVHNRFARIRNHFSHSNPRIFSRESTYSDTYEYPDHIHLLT
jgi:hypothetical protein